MNEAKLLQEHYQVFLYPTHVIIDQSGNIAYVSTGFDDKTIDTLDKEIDELINS